MAATILDGTKIASEIRAEVAGGARALAEAGMRPGLAVVPVGHNPASEIYVRGKVKSSKKSVSIARSTLHRTQPRPTNFWHWSKI
jgi:5,10-methylene-tetrahydrofolate dehydrogenase/methenyl tetrahydrofolate cyclohydrolase